MTARDVTFAPLPARAMADEALSALDLRVLAALTAHDRFGANGIGCYASHSRLAGLVKCHLKSMSRSLRVLAEGGYIDAVPFALNKRQRVYRVLYTAADLAVMSSRIGNDTVTNETPIGNQPVTVEGPIGNQHFQEVEQYHIDAEDNILGEAYKISRETVENNSPEGASPVGEKMLGNEEPTLSALSVRARRGGDFIGETRRFTAVIGGRS
jgi:hypothetical protein